MFLLLLACSSPSVSEKVRDQVTCSAPADQDPDYAAVFDRSRVQRVDIQIAASDYAAMYAEMEELTGTAFGAGGGLQGGGGQQGEPPADVLEAMAGACEGLLEGAACSVQAGPQALAGTCSTWTDGSLVCLPEGAPGGGGGGGGEGGGLELLADDPSYVEATVSVDAQSWCGVGMRFKGNSTLSQSWSAGIGKLPFRLNFDYYEDVYPELEDQKFFGFKELSAGSNVMDDTVLRDVLASEVLEDRGVPAAQNSFWKVYVDTGDGPAYWGLYTFAEDPSDAMMDRVFGEDDGNMYKPDGTCASFACFDEASFEKKNNEDEADWSDIIALHATLANTDSDAATWRAELESQIDVEAFLRWLAVNSALENWDAYGLMAHNYYLYSVEGDDGRFQWIPWDHNLSQANSMMGETDVMQDSVTDAWPLIRRLLDDPVYAAFYEDQLALAVEGAYAQEAYEARIDTLAALVLPALFGEEGEQEGFSGLTDEATWTEAIAALKAHGVSRRSEVVEALNP